MAERSPYVVLGVSPDESAEGIHSAYRALAKRYHPDVGGEGATDAFQRITEAYRVLSDPATRRDYDERAARTRAPEAESRQGIHFDLVLTPDEAMRGGIVRVPVPVPATCATCEGSGWDWVLPCPACSGRGVVAIEPRVDVVIGAGIRSGALVEVPLAQLGLDGWALRLHVVVER